jgi:NCS1 family nucleobase:cation symporter-1
MIKLIYQIFLFSITGVLLCDYYIVQKGKLDLKSLYTAQRNGNYWYTYGVNWRAMAAYVVGAALNFVGCKSLQRPLNPYTDISVLDNMGLKGVKLSVKRSFYFAWITSLFGAALTYYLLARFFPQKSYVMNKSEKWSEWTQDKVEAWGAARRMGDRDGAELVDETFAKESEVVEDMDEKDVELVGGGNEKDKRDRVGVAVLEA